MLSSEDAFDSFKGSYADEYSEGVVKDVGDEVPKTFVRRCVRGS